MNAFPDIRKPSALSGGLEDPFVEDTFETGNDAARPLFTKPRQAVSTLRWSSLTQADFATLEAFVFSQRATPFSWTHPDTGAEHTARFTPGALKQSREGKRPGRVAVDLQIRILS